jgi:murein DD-endopeptidase MepM/ murein hydrolase activator NlpD
MYPPHLHFEIHKDLSIGVNHMQGTRDLRSYWIPTDFIVERRQLGGGNRMVPTPAANFLLPTPENPWSVHFPLWGKKKSSSSESVKKSAYPKKKKKKHLDEDTQG